MLTVVLIAAAYLAGGLPFGVWLARLVGVDVRRSGSGNIGATNVARTAGWRLGVLTLLGDAAKGIIPTLVACRFGGGPWTVAAVGISAVCGHVFSPLLRFRGGKGVATAAGVFLIAVPPAFGVALVIFAVTASLTRYVSLASILAVLSAPVTTFLLGYCAALQALSLSVAAIVVWRHAENVGRLLSGREPMFRARK